MELLPIIKSNNPKAVVIILSGKSNVNINPTAGNYSITAFIKKDDNAFDHIAAIVKRHTAKYELDLQQSRSRFATRLFISILIISIIIFFIIISFTPAVF